MMRAKFFDTIKKRLKEPRAFRQVLAGPRLVGKTTPLAKSWLNPTWCLMTHQRMSRPCGTASGLGSNASSAECGPGAGPVPS